MRRLFQFLGGALAGLLLLAAAGWWVARPGAPDAFYAPPADPPPAPGALLRVAAFDRGVPPDALAWRILYGTTSLGGTPAVASAIVLVSRKAHDGPRPAIAWTHGTTGVVPGCAPSLLDDPFANVPALRQLVDKGWILVATDYAGLGTSGAQSYLVGEGEARSALDSIRAVRHMKDVRAGDDTVVWGHSQGGHAALWTGILAPTYAPEVAIKGVAAVAPASDLRPLLEAMKGTEVGRIMSSFILRSFSDVYPDVRFEAYVQGPKRWAARDMAGRCLAGRDALFSVIEAALTGGSIFSVAPSSGALGERLAQNTPDRPLRQPLLIAQGLADDLVLPEVQSRFVRDRCDAGQAREYRSYAGRDHLSVVAADSPLIAELVRWTQDRLDGVPWSATCGAVDARQPVAADVDSPQD